MSKDHKEVQPGKEAIATVRIRTGGVHYSGIAGSNVIVCELIRFHPAGVIFDATEAEGGLSHVVPYANVEIVTLAE